MTEAGALLRGPHGLCPPASFPPTVHPENVDRAGQRSKLQLTSLIESP